MAEKRFDEATGQTTTGHSYDGIEELNTPMPKWWLWTFYATAFWGLIYTILYPAWPMISGATEGVLGYSSRAEVAQEITAHEQANADLVNELLITDMASLAPQSDLHRYAVARGASVFRAQCSQCHGSGAAGSPGYPNLLDNDWLWGGTLDEISFSIRHGIRNATDDDARLSEMPRFADILEQPDIETLADFVLALPSGTVSAKGSQLFGDNCAACHGENGTGNPEFGAPNLVDAIWLFGGSRDDIIRSISQPRLGVMPAWGQRLNEADVKSVATYVHSLGGGE